MCGIIGVIGKFDKKALHSALQCISHRGPDNSGYFAEEGIGLGHARLSIQDLSENGNQPMYSPDQRYVIIFNGEIYNHLELRKKYLSEFSFRSTSDTETLLYGYIKLGEKILDHLNGIFSFAILDRTSGNLLIARDHFGVKPLYYYESPDMFLFGSEIKSFLHFPALNKKIDPASLVNYLYFLWSPGSKTPFTNVKKLEAGHWIKVDTKSRKTSVSQYYEIPFNGQYLKETEETLIRLLEEKLIAAVDRQMISDVPVGFFLSGGLDSSALVAFVRALYPKKRIQCFTILNEGLEQTEGFSDDYYYAEKVASHLDADLEVVKSEVDIMKDFDKMIWHLDEPQADPAPLHVYNISKRAKQMGYKVLIGGAAGDDVFSGYRRHQALNFEKYFQLIPPFAGKGIKQLMNLGNARNPFIRRARKLLQNIDKTKLDRILSYYGWLDENKIAELFSPKLTPFVKNYKPKAFLQELLTNIPSEESDLNKMLFLELKTFLKDHNLNYTDKMSMATGVEVRVPFLDKELVEFSCLIPPEYKMKGTTTKYLFRKVMEKYLPHEVIYRPKAGFGAPVRKWIIEDLDKLIKTRLAPERLNARGIFNPDTVWKLINENKTGKIDASYTVWSLLAIDSWLNQFTSSTEEENQ